MTTDSSFRCRVSEIEPACQSAAQQTPPAALPAYRRVMATGDETTAVTAAAARAGAARSLFLPSVRERPFSKPSLLPLDPSLDLLVLR